MIKIERKGNRLIVTYSKDGGGNDWVYSLLKNKGHFHLKSTLYFEKKDLLSNEDKPDEPVKFNLCDHIKDGYFKIEKKFLQISYDLFLHQSIEVSRKTFLTDDEGMSIFGTLDKFNLSRLYIGGDHPEAVSKETFDKIVKAVPGRYEKQLYVAARIDAVLKNYFTTGVKAEEKFSKYLNKKASVKGSSLKGLVRYEAKKFELILNKLKDMLASEQEYNEIVWQKEILDIVLLLYPKYIHVFENTPIKDPHEQKTRKLDFMLVDAGGNIDIIEIKKPFDSCIVTDSQYRDNYIPLRELSGTVMQIEKYLFHLKGWGIRGEKYLTEKYKSILPKNFKIQIINPTGIIIMGREIGLSSAQLKDFEVIKRQYKNVVDIITYDDLIRRLEFTVQQLVPDLKAK